MDTKIDLNRIRFDEKLSLKLRSIYEGYGYLPYKMSKFEEYDLYSKNKDFLGDGGILTFTDVSGRLMALKPDVTLSIVKNSKGSTGTQKVYYKENVYRTSRKGGGFKEIQQCGIECIGNVDNYEIIEVLLLALESLKATGRPFKLEISHIGILSSLMSDINISDNDISELITCIKRKNSDGISEVAEKNGIDLSVLSSVVALNGNAADIVNELRNLCSDRCRDDIETLDMVINELSELGFSNNIGIDLSIMNDMNYYRSLVFRGYVDCIPESVLIGGRYDDVVKKMGRDCGAIGFAVALDKLNELSKTDDPTYRDVMLVYSDDTSPSIVLNAINCFRKQGKSVIALKNADESQSCGSIVYLGNDCTVKDKGDNINA